MKNSKCNKGVSGMAAAAALVLVASLSAAVTAQAAPATVSVTVKSPSVNGADIGVGWRWILEEDRTYPAKPGTPLEDTQATNLYRSYMPVAASGHATTATTTITVPDSTKRYFLSVLPDQSTGAAPGVALDCQAPGNCYTMSGKQILPGMTRLIVPVSPQPVPTAQIFLRAFEDTAPLNNVWDNGERGLGNFAVFLYDAGGQLSTDTYGNPLGTVYEGLNSDGTPHIRRLGDGTIHTMSAEEVNDPLKNPYGLEIGEALIKNIAPGKYGTRVVPTQGEGWQQTATIEGTPGLDNWVKAGEPRYFAEFGPAGHHSEYGFVKNSEKLALTGNGHFADRTGTNSITGTIRNQRMTRPSDSPNSPLGFSAGHRLPACWVGLNNAAGEAVYAGPCDADSNFQISNLEPGTYQLAVFDEYLLQIFNLVSVTVPAGSVGATVAVGDVPTFRWFQTQDHWVFYDKNENGQRDADEPGIPEQVINLRYRDGSIYLSSATDTAGYVPFDETFPFFSWLVAEVDYARYKATGVTVAIDAGGPVQGTEDGGDTPRLNATNTGHGVLNPQIQDPNPADPSEAGIATNGGRTRTECVDKDAPGATDTDGCFAGGPPLTEGYNAFISTTNTFEWGKKEWAPGENGGISGVVYYQTTRAENDARFAAPEPWEPGIPRVPLALYRSSTQGVIYHKALDGSRGALSSATSPAVLADVDYFPFCWTDADAAADTTLCPNGATPEPGVDIDRNGNTVFDLGDALEVTHTDSFDDSPPTNCPGDPLDSKHLPLNGEAPTPFNGRCYDGLRNYNQVRPAVFDGGYAFGKPFTDLALTPGNYVVQSFPPPHYTIQREEDKNVDFGDTMTLALQALPPVCVGASHTVPAELALFPGVQTKDAGQARPLCDMRLVTVADGKNTASDFFMFTEVPVTGHIQGFVLNDLANEFDPKSPNFGEKFAPSFIPVSVRDYAGNEVYHTTTDAWGTYNAIVPSTYRINTPMASGVSPNILQVCLNSPMMEDPANPGRYIPDPNFNKQYTQFCYTLNFQPGQTTFLDTPVLPIAAFASPGNAECDCDYPAGTPVVHSAVSNSFGGPVVASTGGTLTITSRGTVMVPDPTAVRSDGNNGLNGNPPIPRDYSFGSSGTITLNGVELAHSTWNASSMTVTIPAGASTGQLVITRTDGAKPVQSVNSVTVTVVADTSRVHPVAVGGSIQAVIDAPTTRPGDVVVVPTGNYQEMLVMTKPIQLVGAGAASTIINPVQSPTEKINSWREKVNYLANCSHTLGLLPNQPNNTASAAGPCGFLPGTGLFNGIEGPGILVAPPAGAFNGTPARIDGFTITGADQSAGIMVNGYARFLEISNNVVSNNQGGAAAGIRVGHPVMVAANEDLVDAGNYNVSIHHNHVRENGGLFEPGAGIGLYTGSNNYRVTNNFICGNFAQADGGGIAHFGRSPNGLIADNKIVFNQSFDQTAGAGGFGGGILIAGVEPQAAAAVQLSGGSGAVQVLRNLIQGNNAGSGDGGGLALRSVNGAEVLTVGLGGANPTAETIRRRFDEIQILSNIIVNNVAGLAGGGLSMVDALNVSVINNTIANNDSTATAAAALNPGNGESAGPQPAGIVSRANSAGLTAAAAARVAGSGDLLEQAVGTFSSPLLQNDIILGNRSLVWSLDPAFPSFPATGQVYGNLAEATPRFWDLAVMGTAGSLEPVASVMTQSSETNPLQPACVAGGLTLNVCLSGDLAAEGTLLVKPYRHGDVGGNHVPGGEFPIQAAAAVDEGGNFIDVRYGPLTTDAGDYHLVPASNAIDAGSAPPARYRGSLADIDRDGRPYSASTPRRYDIGADEVAVGVLGDQFTNANDAPIIRTPNVAVALDAFVGTPFYYQVVAIDPNGDPLTFSLNVANVPAAGGAPSISASGLLSWTPADTTRSCDTRNGGNRDPLSLTVTVSDGKASSVSTEICVRARNAQTPVAVNDPAAAPGTAYQVDVNGAFTVAARPNGVLRNDTPTPNQLTAELASNLAAGGSVALSPNGSFVYTPKLGWVGTDSFTYYAVSPSGELSNAATATLQKRVAVIDAFFAKGDWNVTGASQDAAQALYFRRARPVGGNAPCTGDADCPLIGALAPSGAEWTFAGPGATIGWEPGDVLNIFATTDLSQPLLRNVAVSALDPRTAPNSTAYVQCPGDTNGNAVQDAGETWAPNQVCKHLAAGDGFAVMADGTELYTFGFNDVTGVDPKLAIDKGILNAQFPAPTLSFKEGEQAYVTLTNVGMLKRPDLFDPHSVHFHGFPNAGTVFDGVPESSVGINMGFSLTYYYKIQEPGTYMYHCHVEAAEHMQMGMLGNLFVDPAQNGTLLGGHDKFVYNDGDGSTGYDVFKAIQISSFDSTFHKEHIAVQPLPFAGMRDDYPMLNGRGYPATVSPDLVAVGEEKAGSGVTSADESSQKLDSIVTARSGQKILLRISNLSVTQFASLATTGGLQMQVVGIGAHVLRGPGATNGTGQDLYYKTRSVTLGGGESADVLIDTTGVAPGRYLLYTTNLNNLSNGPQDFGGMMTEIIITAP